MVVGRSVTQLAVQNETRRSHVDDQFAASTIIDFPSGMMAFESKVSQLLEGGIELWSSPSLAQSIVTSGH